MAESRKDWEELTENAVCANECTGALQKISSDPEEVRKIHEQFIRGTNRGKKR